MALKTCRKFNSTLEKRRKKDFVKLKEKKTFLSYLLFVPKFSNGFISVFIEKSKADQLREGQSVVIAESGSTLCPVTLLKL